MLHLPLLYSPISAPSLPSFHLQVQVSLVGTKFFPSQNQQIFRPQAGTVLLPSLKLSVLPTCPSLTVPGELPLLEHYPGYLATYLHSPESLSSAVAPLLLASDQWLAWSLLWMRTWISGPWLLGSNLMTLLWFGILTDDLVLDRPQFLSILHLQFTWSGISITMMAIQPGFSR